MISTNDLQNKAGWNVITGSAKLLQASEISAICMTQFGIKKLFLRYTFTLAEKDILT